MTNSSKLSPTIAIPSDIFDLVSRFLQNKRLEVVQVEKALEKNDIEAVELFAHKIKGVGKMYGFPEITTIGHELEMSAKEKNEANSSKYLLEMKHYLTNVKIERKDSA